MSLPELLRDTSELASEFLKEHPAVGDLVSGTLKAVQAETVRRAVEWLRRPDVLKSLEKSKDDPRARELLLSVFEEAVKTRSEEKRDRFARFLASQTVENIGSIDEADVAFRMIKELEDLHIQVLQAGVKQTTDPVYVGDKFFTIRGNALEPIQVPPPAVGGPDPLMEFTCDPGVIRFVCADLIAKGLLTVPGPMYTEESSRQDAYCLTDSVEWLFKWITEPVDSVSK